MTPRRPGPVVDRRRRARRLGASGIAGAIVFLACPAPTAAAPVLLARSGCLPPATTPVADLPWSQARLAAQDVWHLTRGGGQTVAVIGTGVDAQVRQLRGRVQPGVDLGAGPADQDCLGSGTFVAGIIAARPVSGVAFAGVAPAARILPIRVAGDRLPDDPRVLDQAIRRAVDGGAQVVCIAVPLFDGTAALRDAVAYAAARDVLIVTVAPPRANRDAALDDDVLGRVLTVGAINPAGAPVGDARAGSVDVVAPGADVTSLGPGGPGHLVRSGREAAVPFVAGTAALVRAYYPDLTAAQVKRRLQLTADRPGTSLPDPQLGWGTVNPYTAVTMVLPEEQGAVPVAAPSPNRVTPLGREATDHRAVHAALATLGVAGGVTIVVAGAAVAVRHGRNRRSGA